MGFKEKMMNDMINKFFNKMKPDEKQSMMNEMMDKFFGSMSPEEKKEMMQNMMPRMMESMMGNRGFSMPDMMKKMMGGMSSMMQGKKGDGTGEAGTMEFNPMEMCHKMMMMTEKSNELASYATPEVRALFEEWAEQIEDEIFKYISEINTTDVEKLAEHFKLSKNSINFFLSKLAQKDKINLKAENR